MIVLLASRFDEHAAWLAERWKQRGACLLTSEGLSLRGWRHEAALPERSLAVLGGVPVPVPDLRGVFTRLAAVTEAELPHIVEAERAYVAAEMQAFLLAWLGSLGCPVLNTPTPLCLNGPAWRQEQWLRAAARAGLRTKPTQRAAPTLAETLAPGTSANVPTSGHDYFAVAMVRGRCFANGIQVDDALVAGLRRLSEGAGSELMTATFETTEAGTTFVAGSPTIDLSRPELGDAVLEAFEGHS